MKIDREDIQNVINMLQYISIKNGTEEIFCQKYSFI